MKYKIENNIITINIVGKIDSTNHNEAYSEIKEILDNNQFESILLDFKEVNYISSAGLRAILKLKKDNYPDE